MISSVVGQGSFTLEVSVRSEHKPSASHDQLLVLSTAPNRLTAFQKFSYGIGHFYNDMCASMWFTYLLLFYHMVICISSTYAGLILLIGQVADAMATPVIGFLCDRIPCPYGRRKFWHLAGTVMVSLSFFFFWHQCLPCGTVHCRTEETLGCSNCTSGKTLHRSTGPWELVYFSSFVVVFQFGWAAVQVAHLSLIPALTDKEDERVGLNAIRYGFTIVANMSVFVVMFTLLETISGEDNHQINLSDEWIFSGTALGIIAVGLVLTVFFHVGIVEPRAPLEQREGRALSHTGPWYKWFASPRFYMVAVIYMCSRLIVNITQVYLPLYLIDSLKIEKASVAIGPLTAYMSGFIVTLMLRPINKVIGTYMVYVSGLVLLWGSMLWFWFQPLPDPQAASGPSSGNAIYGAAVLHGAGGAAILIASLSMATDLIGASVGSSAFLYGLMSFCDKLSNGIAIQTIEVFHPCQGHKGDGYSTCPGFSPYYHGVLVWVPGGSSVIAAATLCLLMVCIYQGRCRGEHIYDATPPTDTSVPDAPAPGNTGIIQLQESSVYDVIEAPGRHGDQTDAHRETRPLLREKTS